MSGFRDYSLIKNHDRYNIVDVFNKNIDFLIVKKRINSSKELKAIKNNIKILSLDEFNNKNY